MIRKIDNARTVCNDFALDEKAVWNFMTQKPPSELGPPTFEVQLVSDNISD